MKMFYSDDVNNVRSLTKAGVVFLVSLFTVVLLYFVLSTPVNALYDGFGGADWAGAESQKAGYMGLIRGATTLFFSILITIPVVWFFLWVFHREPVYFSNMNKWR